MDHDNTDKSHSERNEMTNAILFNATRGSGREVTVHLIDAGVEIISAGGDPIAVWPYGVIDLIKHTNLSDEGEFVVEHDPFNTLQSVEPDIFQAIIKRAPQARQTLQGSVWNFGRLWQGIPRNLQGVLIVAVGYGLYEGYIWLF